MFREKMQRLGQKLLDSKYRLNAANGKARGFIKVELHYYIRVHIEEYRHQPSVYCIQVTIGFKNFNEMHVYFETGDPGNDLDAFIKDLDVKAKAFLAFINFMEK